MTSIHRSFRELIGHTPMLELANIEREFNLRATVAVKLEGFNPAGSIMVRTTYDMVADAEKRDNLKPGGTIIEATGGNTGVALAAVAAIKGYHVILTMPDNVSVEFRGLAKAYGAEVVLTDAAHGMQGAIDRATELDQTIENSCFLGQFINPVNPLTHFLSTGNEIYEQTDGKVDIFIAGVGTGGTITGIGECLKMKKSDVNIVAVEPASSPVLSDGDAGAHTIQGIGAGFVPALLNRKIIDSIMTVSDDDAKSACALMAQKEGLLIGPSSGAVLHAAIELAGKDRNLNKLIVALFPDSGERYLSSSLFN